MTQKEKELLTKVLCEQLPNSVKVHCKWFMFQETTPTEDIGVLVRISNKKALVKRQNQTTVFYLNSCGCIILPYLRPMSSMTEEERLELSRLSDDKFKFYLYTGEPEIICYEKYNYLEGLKILDWLNTHHFDYRGLIDKGLAIVAVGENNPYKEN